MDTETEAYLSHLMGLAAGDCAPDAALTDSFAQGLLFHQPSLFPSHTCSPAIKNILSLLFRVCGSAPQEYTYLLNKILSHLSLSQIYSHVSEDVIFSNIDTTFVDVLASKVKSEEPSEVVAFVEGKKVVSRLVQVLFSPATGFTLAEKISNFFGLYYSTCDVPEPASFWRKWVQSPDFSPETAAYAGPASFYSYIEVLAVMDACKVGQETMEKALDLNVSKVVDDPAEVDFAMVTLADFLATHLKAHELGANSLKLVSQVLGRFGSLLDSNEASFSVVSSCNRLLVAMLNGVSHREPALHFLQAHPPKVDLSGNGGREFCQYDLAVFADPSAVFRAHFAGKSIESVPEPVFYAFLHLISDQRFFKLLVDSGSFGERNLERLSRDMWLETMWRLVQTAHGVQYVLGEPGLLPKLLANESVFSEQTQSIKRAIFRRLSESGVDLGVYTDAVQVASRQ